MSHTPNQPGLTQGLKNPFAIFADPGHVNHNYFDRRRSSPIEDTADIKSLKRAKARLTKRCATLSTTVKALKAECTHDALTGLLNRRGLAETYAHLQRVKLQPGRGHALVFLDGDGFGQINKVYGDAVGDRVIQAIARSLERYTRKGDIRVRKGGDEFIVILKNIRPEDLESIVNSPKGLRARLNAHTRVDTGNNVTLAIRASVGAVFFQPDETLGTILERADHAMRGQKLVQKALKLLNQGV